MPGLTVTGRERAIPLPIDPVVANDHTDALALQSVSSFRAPQRSGTTREFDEHFHMLYEESEWSKSHFFALHSDLIRPAFLQI